MKFALLLALAITTHVRDYVDKYGVYDTSVWRNHEAVGAFTDGVVCYVTAADGPSCHRAVPRPTYREIK